MKTAFTKDFRKTLKKIQDNQLHKAISEAVVECKAAKDLREISNLKKLIGYKTAYRIKFKSYRIGVYIENGTVTFTVFAHRKDIYRKFP